MGQKTVAEKLGVGAGDRLLTLGAPTGYEDTLGPLPADAEWSRTADGVYDVVQLFVPDAAALSAAFQTATVALAPEGRLWITSPKLGGPVDSDLSRDDLRDRLAERGWRGARQIAVDDAWSAIRFRPTE